MSDPYADYVDSLPNDVKIILEGKAQQVYHQMEHLRRIHASKAKAMPVPELHTALMQKRPDDMRRYIHFEFEGQIYVLSINTVADFKGISLRKAHGNQLDYEHDDYLDHNEFIDNLDRRDAEYGNPNVDPDRVLYFMTYYDYGEMETTYIIKVFRKDSKTRSLMQALLTVVRKVFPSVTPENIKIQEGSSEYVLSEFMHMLKNVQGGAQSVKFEGRVYKLHNHKNGTYITVNKARVFLKDIRRRYRYTH
jgi:hypothetical protein